MNSSLIELLRNWNKNNDDRTKIQHAYLVGTIVLLFTAGIVSLINYDLGQVLLFGTLSLLVIFIANSVAWALLNTFVLSRIKTTRNTKK